MRETFLHSLAVRAHDDQILDDFKTFLAIEGTVKVLDALPQVTALLNKERQVVFSNKALKEMLGKEQLDEILGKRVGELIYCKNADNDTGGCGTSQKCTVCGALNAIIESQILNQKTTKDCRVNTGYNGIESSLDLKVTASPFRIDESRFTLLSISDVSNQKRKQIFERIFFHDIINTAGALKGNLEYLPLVKDKKESERVIKEVNVLSEDLIEEILSQRDLAAAEAGDLDVFKTKINSLDILFFIKSKLLRHSTANNKSIQIDVSSLNINLETDELLLKRVLTNMLKNALEATHENGVVKMGVKPEFDKVEFWVQNSVVMPRNVQLQVFQRSFSTKGHNRGLGTYSMKLITEKYLDGKIDFVSREGQGTKFFVQL